MPSDSPRQGMPTVGRVGLAAIGMALACRALALPLAAGCLAALAGAAWLLDTGAKTAAPIPAPPRKSRSRRRDNSVTVASEDSFPASDPPAWTPVTGTGTRH